MAVKLTMLRDFPTSAPLALREALQRFERNAEDAIRRIGLLLERPMGQTAIIVASGGTVSHGDLNRYDTTRASIEAFLPDPSTVMLREVVVLKMVAGNTLTLRPRSGLINGATTLAITAVGARRIYCDGVGYWA